MKKVVALLLAALLTLGALPLGALAAGGDIAIDAKRFPDAKLRSLVSKHVDRNGDGRLSEAERNAVKTLDAFDKGIASLKGIELFPKLAELDASGNRLAQVDLGGNAALKTVFLMNNRLTSISLGKLTKLKALYVNKNRLTALDVSKNPALEELDCADNRLTRLSLKGVPRLYAVRCDGNSIKSLDISACPKLQKAMREMELHGDGTWAGCSAGDFYGVNVPANCTVAAGGKTLYDPKAAPKLAAASITLGVGERRRVVARGSQFPGYLCKVRFSPKGVARIHEGVEYEPGYLAVKGVKPGTTRLTLTTPAGQKVSCAVTVKKAPTRVRLSETQLRLKVGEKATLKAALSPSGSASALAFGSSNRKVAKVSSGGVVTGVKPGKARVAVKTYNGKLAYCDVTVHK